MDEKRKVVYSALKPTGDLQLGNYIGALRNMVAMQEEFDCIYTVAGLQTAEKVRHGVNLRPTDVHQIAAKGHHIGIKTVTYFNNTFRLMLRPHHRPDMQIGYLYYRIPVE